MSDRPSSTPRDAAGSLQVFPGFRDDCVARALPAAREVARAPVVFRASDDAFRVDEIPAYLPCGEGEHLYLHVEKRGLSTPSLVRRLQERFGLHERDIGYAGRKDERGITRQWLSVPARVVEPDVAAVEACGVQLLEARRHKNKLRLGHLRGNRFTILLDGASIDADALAARALEVAPGVPNLFGAQRFGAGDSTIAQACAFLDRARPARSRRDEFLVSALQSSLFNAWLADRVDDGSWRTPLDGDVLEKIPTGAPFICTDPAADAMRAARGEVCVSGPLLGRAMRCAEREAMTRESRSWLTRGIDAVRLLAHPAFGTGARRPSIVAPMELEVRREAACVSIQFSLPKGAYASVVLRALLGTALVDAALADGPIEPRADMPPQG